MANKFVIEVRAKGFKNLEGQLNKANGAMDKFGKGSQRAGKHASGMRKSIALVRNSVLLYTFAISAAVKAVGTFVGASAKFEAVRTRLVGLTGSVEKANKAFETFNAVAATTPFSLDDVVNAGAQLKAFGADAEALIKPITDLAAFMGTTATEAANSFGRAYAGGAGAADILRERGILNIIKSSQGLEDLSKTTLPQFREALISSLQDPVLGIEGSTERLSKTTTGAISNMGDSFTRLAVVIGDKLKPVTDATISSLTNLATATRGVIEGDTRTAVEKLTDEFMEQMRQLDNNVKSSQNLGKEVSNVDDIFAITTARTQALIGAYSEYAGASLELQAHIIEENSSTTIQNNLLETNRQKIKERTEALLEQIVAAGGLGAVNEEQVLTWQKLQEGIESSIIIQDEWLEKQEKVKELKPIDPIRSAFAALDDTQRISIGVTQRLADNFVQAGIAGQNMGQAVGTALKSIAAQIIAQAVVFGMLKTFFAPATLGFGFGSFLAKSIGVGHTGGAITNKGVQAFARGGMVQGKDNVPILAQAGEFIMRREAVQNIGLDQLHQMNQSGQSNNMTVNISAPMVDETVVDHIIPAIEKAARFNLA